MRRGSVRQREPDRSSITRPGSSASIVSVICPRPQLSAVRRLQAWAGVCLLRCGLPSLTLAGLHTQCICELPPLPPHPCNQGCDLAFPVPQSDSNRHCADFKNGRPLQHVLQTTDPLCDLWWTSLAGLRPHIERHGNVQQRSPDDGFASTTARLNQHNRNVARGHQRAVDAANRENKRRVDEYNRQAREPVTSTSGGTPSMKQAQVDKAQRENDAQVDAYNRHVESVNQHNRHSRRSQQDGHRRV